jgi:predicted metal-dependent hydrolase
VIDGIDTPAGRCALRRSGRRTLAISVLPDSRIELAVPHDADLGIVSAKVGKRLRWIVSQQRNFAEMNKARTPPRFVSGATHRYLGRQYRLKVRKGRSGEVKLVGACFFVTARRGGPEEVRDLLAAWFKRKAFEQFPRRLALWNSWCRDRGLPEPRLHLLRMPNRWGSSHRDGRVYLNPDLVKAPSICIDYVIAHEVCHLQHPQHDKAFYLLLDQLFPDWRRIKMRLESLA